MAKTSAEATEKWQRNMRASTEDIRKGIDRVEVAPTKLAADQIDKMRIKLMEAFESGRVEAGLRGVSLEDWKTAFKDVGVGRIAAGVDKAEGKMKDFFDFLLPHVAAGQAKIKAMPSTTLEDNIQRMTTFTRHMASKKYKGR